MPKEIKNTSSQYTSTKKNINLGKSSKEINESFKKANNFFEMGDFVHAVKEYKKAIELGANFPEVFGNLGVALLELSEFKEAVKYLEKCLSMGPIHKIPYIINYSLALFRSGDKKNALEVLSSVLGRTKDDHLEAIAHYHMGLFLIDSNPKKALKHFKTSLKFEENSLTYYEASCTFARLGKKGPAVTMLKKAFRLDSSLIKIALQDEDLKEIIHMPVIKHFLDQI